MLKNLKRERERAAAMLKPLRRLHVLWRSSSAFRWGYKTALTVCTLSAISEYVFVIKAVRGPSMAPTLSPNYADRREKDYILIMQNRAAGWQRRPLRRGDIVTFLKPHNPSETTLKRIVGLPGDTIMRDPRRLELQEEKGKGLAKRFGLGLLPPLVRVPEGKVWVEGDNWRCTLDSNELGPVPMALIQGTARYVVWPPHRIGRIEDARQGSDKSRTKAIPMPAEADIVLGLV